MIFVDTSFWVSLSMSSDAHHGEAISLLREHQSTRLLSTNHVRGETWTFLRRRSGDRTAVRFLDLLARTPRVSVVSVREELEAGAIDWLRRHDEREYSFVDATSFSTMRALRIDTALAFDGDFSAAGFIELRA